MFLTLGIFTTEGANKITIIIIIIITIIIIGIIIFHFKHSKREI